MLGINLSGAEFGKGSTYGYDYKYPTFKDLSFYAEKGLTLVRLPVKWERLQPDQGGKLDEAELGRLKLFLDNAAKAGVEVIVDVHNFGRYDGKAIGSAALPVATFADFWAKLAGAIGHKSAVYGYDLMNEPHGMPTKTAWPEAAQAATDAIRALGDTHTIFVEGEHWAGASNWAAENPYLDVKDPLDNIVYEAHVYFDNDGSGIYDGTYDQEKATADIGSRRLKSFIGWLQQKDAKGFIGEFGAPSDDPRWQVVLDNFLTTMRDNNLSGTYWGAGAWFNGYNVGLLDKKGNAKASLETLLAHVEDNLDVGVGAMVAAIATVATGGAGDDVLAGTDPAGRYDGGAGIDRVDFSTATTVVKASLADARFVGIENLAGGAAGDVLTGNAGANMLSGHGGNDVLDGGAGADMMVGGEGNDIYRVDDAGDQTVERLGEGVADTVHATISWTLSAFTENLVLEAGAVNGTGTAFANRITGNAAANTLTGLAGNDVLDGGAGADRLIGGTGDDSYHVDDAGDVIVEAAREGTDTVLASIDWTLGTNLEKLTLTGTGALTGTGNGGDNVLTGNAGANLLFGFGGDDVLDGGAGNDRLDGGKDDDTLNGGAGDDVLIGGQGRDWLTGGAGKDLFTFTAAGESKITGADRIVDFQVGTDRIDLSGIDANTKTAGNQSFRFIGEADFSRKAGELRIEMRDNDLLVRGDSNGDGVADFVAVLLDFSYKLTETDFVL